jgi:Zn-dependent peptidase ImmA (M78 family)
MGSYFRAVRPMSLQSIEDAANHLRKLLRIDTTTRVQMINLIENVLPEVLPEYIFAVMPDEDMPGMDGLSAIGSYTICLAEHTYLHLCDGDPEARMVAAHEFGHLILHSQQQPALARRTFNDDSVDPEWQADRFAEFWLMPTSGVKLCNSATEVAERFSVPIQAAERRFAKFDKIQGELF